MTITLLAIVGGIVSSQISLDEEGISTHLNAHSMGQVRDALLTFRQDMGYFPGHGPLAPDKLDLSDFSSITSSGNADASQKLKWAGLNTNFWQLFKQPKALGFPVFWDYDRQAQRGWNGPYIAAYSLKLHDVDPEDYNVSGDYNNVYAIADNFDDTFRSKHAKKTDTKYWAIEPASSDDDIKYYPGSPLVLLEEDGDYYLISCGPDGNLDQALPLNYTDDDVILGLGR